MDEMDVTAAESKATYDEIREWVQDNYGFRVTNLNIAQVKRKHGIIERENYNKPKSLDSKQPGCTEEKVKAIEAALHYFKMIYEVQECYSAREISIEATRNVIIPLSLLDEQ
ncbi:MAG: 23S rRNA methyltransferase [Oscillospiraceae bacterium]|nr:23S rRNA methyltransferase [Oscillospiraceae bacterium]